MPKPLQIKLLKTRFRKLNKFADEQEIDWESYVDETLTYRENLRTLEYAYPKYLWRKPEYMKKRKRSVRHRIVIVKPHRQKSKGRIYEYGAVFLLFPPEWIGKKNRVDIHVIDEEVSPPPDIFEEVP